MRHRLSRTGTATSRRCIPMRVPPMSSPPWARTRSTTTGAWNACQAVAAKLPPALGLGTTQTGSYPYCRAQSRSTTSARLRCSQHWAASQIPPLATGDRCRQTPPGPPPGWRPVRSARPRSPRRSSPPPAARPWAAQPPPAAPGPPAGPGRPTAAFCPRPIPPSVCPPGRGPGEALAPPPDRPPLPLFSM